MSAESTDIALASQTSLAEIYGQKGGIDAILARIEAEALAHTADVSTVKGRKEIASLAHKVARSKTALDDAGKSLTDGMRAQINAVDADRRIVRARLDALKERVRKPLTDWEAAEGARIDALKDRLSRLTHASPQSDTSEAIADLLARVEACAIDDTWSEFVADAAKAKDATLARLRAAMEQAVQREEQAAELVRLRAEAEARAAEEKARLAAEEAERRRIAAAAAEAERAANIEREKAEAVERAKLAAEAAAAEAAKRAAEEAQRQIDAARREAEMARQAAERAAQAERDRIAAEKAEAEERARQRAADAAHRAGILRDISEAIQPLPREQIAAALVDGRIPHVRVML